MTFITEAHVAACFDHPHWPEFIEYNRDNPDTLRWLNKMAHRAKERGYEHGSVKWLIEMGRWEEGKDFTMGSSFRDWFSALYARWLMVEDPTLDDFFELRKFEHERG